MKKILALLLAMILMFSLAACEEDDDDRPGRRETKPGTTEGNNSLLGGLFGTEDDEKNGSVEPSTPNQEETNEFIVAEVGEYTVSATEFAYFYGDAITGYDSLLDSMSKVWFGDEGKMYVIIGTDEERPYNPTVSLKDQIYDQETGETWEDHYKNVALDNLHNVYALYEDAQKRGYTMTDEDREKIESDINVAVIYAQFCGFETTDAYLQYLYGQGADLTSYKAYLNKCVLAQSYKTAYEKTLQFTEEEIWNYMQEHDYSDIPNVKLVNVRHVLSRLSGETDAERQEALIKAQEWLYMWQTGPATEASFAELANEYSADHSGEGGLIEDIYPGMTVENFNAWCFDPDRKPGDTEIVETEYGYHVMYFSSYDERSYLDVVVREDIRLDAIKAWEETLRERTPLVIVDLDQLELVAG